jgi:hypothetical protein
MSENMQTITEAAKIIGKYIILFAASCALILTSIQGYKYFDYTDEMATLYGPPTVFIPFLIGVIFMIIWAEAKHKVQIRNNEEI